MSAVPQQFEYEYESFVPRYVVEQLAAAGRIEPVDLRLDQATLLFADITGSTAMGENLAQLGRGGAEEMARRLNEFFGALIDAVHAHGGDITGFAGDSLMAYWTDDAAGAIDAALDIQQRVRALDISSEQLSVRLSVGVGSLRRLILGGNNDRWNSVVSGTALLDAGRANDMSQPNEVVISAAVAAMHGDTYAGAVVGQGCVRLDPHEAPGHDTTGHDTAGLASTGTGSNTGDTGSPIDAPAVDRELLRSFVASPVLAHLEGGRQDWLAELRTVTVVFISLPDLGPDTPLHEAQRLINGIQHEIAKVDASMNKVSVDDKGIAVVAALGMPPRAHEDDPARGARLALALEHSAQAAGTRCYVGVSTGRVFCGTVGNAHRREYTMTGTAVNRSARLMQHAMKIDPSAAVVADEATMAAVASLVAHTPLPEVQLKGIGAASPTRLHGLQDTGRAANRREAAFVGRQGELHRLRAALGDTTGPAPIAVIEGEPGIGKSTLAEQGMLAARAGGRRTVTAAGDSIDLSVPYAPIRSLVRQLLDLPVGDIEGQRRAILEALGPGLAPQAALLGDILPLPFEPTAATLDLPADAGPSIVQSLVGAALSQIASAQATLLHLDDFHWFDSGSVGVITAVAANSSAGLLITARSEEADLGALAAITSPAHALRFHLGPLDRAEVGSLVASTLGAVAADDRVADAVFVRGGGHPLFSQELALAMNEQELLEIDEAGIVKARQRVDLQNASFPDSLEGIIGQRIDRLSSADQVTLKAASVLGTAFTIEPLQAIHPERQRVDALLTSLDALERQGMIIRNGDDLEFVHNLTRDVAYDRLLFSQRATLHAALAQWYASEFDEREVLGRLAHHWEQSWLCATAIERPPVDVNYVQANAANALEKATDAANASGLLLQALQLGLRATRVLGVRLPTETAMVGPAIGAEMQRIGELAGANEPHQLLDLPQLTNSDIQRAVMLILRIQPVAAMIQDRDLFALMALRNYSLVLEHGLGVGAPGAIAVYGSLELLMSGDSERAHRRTSIALDVARRQGNLMFSYVAFVHGWLVNHWHRPISEIIDTCTEGSAAGFAAGDIIFGSFNAAAVVVSAAMMGMPLGDVVALADKHSAIIDGRVHSAAFHCRHERQLAMALAGGTTDPLSLSDPTYDEATDIASIMDTPSANQIGAYLGSKARLEYLYRHFDAALVYADQTTAVLEAMSGQLLEAEFVFVHALALLQRSTQTDPPRAAELRAQAAVLKARIQQWATNCGPNFTHRLGIVNGVEAWVDGDLAGASVHLDQAADAAAASGFVQHEALAHELAAQVRVGSGDTEAARRSATTAVDAYQRWGAHAKVADVRQQFADLLTA